MIECSYIIYNTQLENIGNKVAELLNLKFNDNGNTKTKWGTKSPIGLGRCIVRIMEEEVESINPTPKI